MLNSLLNALLPRRRHTRQRHKALVDPAQVVPSGPVHCNHHEFRRNSGDSIAPTTTTTDPSPDGGTLSLPVPPHGQRPAAHGGVKRTTHSWVNATHVTKIPPGTPTEILKSFLATVDDEVSVPQGSMVSAMYKDTSGQWVYVKRADGQHGYVPDAICSLMLPARPGSPPPERPKISRRKSQQIKRQLKKFHKREYERRAEQLMTQPQQSSDGSRTPNRYGSSIGHSSRFLRTASIDRVRAKAMRTPSRGSVSAATAAAILAVAQDKQLAHTRRPSIHAPTPSHAYDRGSGVFQSGLVTLERAKPRRMPTAAERQFAMNENLRRFLSSLPEFPAPPPEEPEEEVSRCTGAPDDAGGTLVHETTEEDEGGGGSGRPCAEGKNIHFESRPEERDSDSSGVALAKKITIRMSSGAHTGHFLRRRTTSAPDFAVTSATAVGQAPKPPPKPVTLTLNRGTTGRVGGGAAAKSAQSLTMQRQRRATTAITPQTASLTRVSAKWRPAEPVLHELVAVQDFRAETKIDLDVRKGDRLSTVFSAINGWIWATHTRTNVQGFVPSAAVILASEFS